MNAVSNRLRQLENNVLDTKITEETCHIDISEIPIAELELHRHAHHIVKNRTLEDVTPQERKIVEESALFLSQRTLILFREMCKNLFCINADSGYSLQFDLRLMWFLSESAKLGQQSLDMDELVEANKDLDEDSLDDKQTALEETQPLTFTPESYEEFEKQFFGRLAERMKK